MGPLWQFAAAALALTSVAACFLAILSAREARERARELTGMRRRLAELADDVAGALESAEINRTAWKRIEGRVTKRAARESAGAPETGPAGRPDPKVDPEGWRQWALIHRNPTRMM